MVNASFSQGGGTRSVVLRRSLLVLGLSSVVAALLGGLARLGVTTGVGAATASIHGPLIVLGGFCTVIGLERALAARKAAALATPVIALAGALLLSVRSTAGPWTMAAATLSLCFTNALLLFRSPVVSSWLMFFGSAVLVVGTCAWASGYSVPAASFSWMAFFVITIAAERLELSHLSPLPGWAGLGVSASCQALGYLSLAPLLGITSLDGGIGLALVLIGVWQLRFDIARRMLRKPGLSGYAATCVLAAASWSVIAGVLVMVFGLELAGPRYDAVLHCIFIGYALSMVFAHAPIILPVVGGVRVGFTNYFYVPTCLLHIGLALRVGGDLFGHFLFRQIGGLLSATSLIVFGLTMATSKLRSGGEIY